MPPSSSPDVPPRPAERAIARSRSRYKGPRSQQLLTNSSEPETLSAEQLQKLRNIALSSRYPMSQNNGEDSKGFEIQPPLHGTMQGPQGSANDAQGSEAFLAHGPGNLGEAKNCMLRDEVVSQSQALQGFQQNDQRRRYNAEAKCHQEVGRDTVRSQKIATSPIQYARNLEPDLRSSHGEEVVATSESYAAPRRGITQRFAGQSNGKRLRKSREELKRTISAPIAIETPPNTVKPAFDAPVSAVNAGERRVKVKYDQNLMWLPVTPSTTPLDIIRSAADQLAKSIDENSTILLESFKQLGLERPLRKYEHVRDVLNSWDNDTQNTLVIKPSPTAGRDGLLALQSVSGSQPMDTSVYIHYSQRPGHWDKRWVTLRSDGQMLVAKREGGETANICHISDFDVYVPTARHSAKRIRPPRKICFAVKSQQKSSMFLSTANFVHFFSTSDKTLAASWYNAVAEWRSWYLVNVMGEGGKGAQGSEKVSSKEAIQMGSNTEIAKPKSQSRVSEQSHPGTSLIDTSTFANQNTERIIPFELSSPRHNIAREHVDDMPFRSRDKTRAPQSRKLIRDIKIRTIREHSPSFVQAVRQEEPEPFTATGLLGRTYTQRQKAQREREKAQKAGLDHPDATPNINPVHSLDRTLSQRPKPKPLIDLTPQYQEPPQHAKKGRGVVLEQIPAGGLVEVANTPEAAILIPPSATWRRPTSKTGDGPSVDRSRIVRRDHSSSAPSASKHTSTPSETENMAFTGGLLAINGRGQGGARTGRGVTMSDWLAKGPVLDVGEECQYAPGSLLERVERQSGGSHQILEREKKSEIVLASREST